MKKNILKSKTFWVQMITLGAAFVPPVQALLVSNPETVLGVVAAVNVIVRFTTKGKVTLV